MASKSSEIADETFIMASKSSEIVRSNRNCSFVNCFNTEAKNPELKFYCFPSKSYEIERKERWIQAVKRRTTDGKLWMPSSNSRVCSAHFVGGKKSNNMHDEAYVPSIYPSCYKKKKPNTERYQRLMKRKKRKEAAAVTSAEYEEHEEPIAVEVETKKKSSIGIQTDPCTTPSTNDVNILFCWNGENDICTQTDIYIQQPQKHCNVIIDKPIVTTIEKRCGPDIQMNPGFTGFADIETDSSMRELAGVSRDFFAVLLNLIELGKDGQPAFYRTLGKENRLLLFLMKLKLGITFCALGVLFHVHKATASSIFVQVLQTLTEKTKTWIFWPSKESVKKNLPVTFSKYPNCRCIIDCIEISTDTPATVEQRVLMHSNYKGRFTAKFLIAITPDGYICKVSKAYGGRTTDSFLTNDCGYLNLIEPNDLVLADKGFPQIRSELGKRNTTLVIPPFARNPQFSDEEVDEGYSIASARIHVERVIQRVKLSKILSHIPTNLLPYIDAILHVCCVIANNLPPLIGERNREDTVN